MSGIDALDRGSIEAADTMFGRWITKFASAFENGRSDEFVALFAENAFWKDQMAFCWDYPTYAGRDEIRHALDLCKGRIEPGTVRVAESRTAPRYGRRTGRDVLEGFFDFATDAGHCTGFVRLVRGEAGEDPKIWLLLTSLQELKGFEERIGARRTSGDEFAKNRADGNWHDCRLKEMAFSDRDPQVLIVGAGHSGLSVAARLKYMGADALVIDKVERVGDVWRQRYHSLTLHNQILANHLPYVPFPPTWHTWLPKDKLAGWLEAYVETLELNVWTQTELLSAEYDEAEGLWTARIRKADGSERTMRCPHVIMATGVSGSIPKMPELAGADEFRGRILHSSQFSSGAEFAGQKVAVIGTGNSGHDVAQDLHVHGAQVWMVQRGASCVVSLEPTATSVYSVYSEGPPAEDIDLTTAAVPYPILKDTYQWLTAKARVNDKALLEGLNAVGFETFYGADDTGFHMMYLRGEGGYYIDVGCSELIIRGDIGVIQTRDIDQLVAEGIRLKDGTVIACDAIVTATGFRNMQENVRRLFGDDVADRVGPVWGFDEHFTMRNMWKRTAQPGFWVMGGGLIDARMFSRFLAIQIIASLNGMLKPLGQDNHETALEAAA